MIAEVLIIPLGLGILALLVAAATSPIETLSWWAGWTERELDIEPDVTHTDDTPPSRPFIIYLSGVASLSGEYLIARERIFLRRLEEQLPAAVIVNSVFPYSPSGAPLLAAPRIFDDFWRWLQKLEIEGRRSILSLLIKLRNIYQVMVSADHRYGPIFSQGAAKTIERSLRSAGYRPGIDGRVTIIGYSGGAQVAIGATPFLKARLQSAIEVISIGGVIASDPGLAVLDRLHHFQGDGDNVEKLGAVMFAERWKIFANSHWNTAKRDGRIIVHKMANTLHAGPKGYFGLPKTNGNSNNDRMVDAIAKLFTRAM